MKNTGLSILLFIVHISLFSQNNWLSYQSDSSATKGSPDTLNFNVNNGKVTVYQDKRLDQIGEFLKVGEGSIEGVKIDGFRVLIFFDQDKSLAEQKKAAFISAYPDHKTYVDYMAPNYRVRVGNFRTRLEAESLKAELLNTYPTAIVIEDRIQLPELNTTEK